MNIKNIISERSQTQKGRYNILHSVKYSEEVSSQRYKADQWCPVMARRMHEESLFNRRKCDLMGETSLDGIKYLELY
jgi:hypothetical protein